MFASQQHVQKVFHPNHGGDLHTEEEWICVNKCLIRRDPSTMVLETISFQSIRTFDRSMGFISCDYCLQVSNLFRRCFFLIMVKIFSRRKVEYV